MQKTNNKKQTAKKNANKKGLASAILISIISGVISLLGTALLSSFILNGLASPESLITVMSIVCGIVSGAVCGIFSARLTGSAFPWSIVCGILLLLIFFIISLFFEADTTPDPVYTVIYSAGIVMASFFAGIIASKKKKTKRIR